MLKREYLLRSSASNISFRESGTVNDFSLSLSLSLSYLFKRTPHITADTFSKLFFAQTFQSMMMRVPEVLYLFSIFLRLFLYFLQHDEVLYNVKFLFYLSIFALFMALCGSNTLFSTIGTFLCLS